MTASEPKRLSAYGGSCIILPTKHAKSPAIAPPFWDRLSTRIEDYEVDTDRLGTFTGEVERDSSALFCARRKCK